MIVENGLVKELILNSIWWKKVNPESLGVTILKQPVNFKFRPGIRLALPIPDGPQPEGTGIARHIACETGESRLKQLPEPIATRT